MDTPDRRIVERREEVAACCGSLSWFLAFSSHRRLYAGRHQDWNRTLLSRYGLNRFTGIRTISHAVLLPIAGVSTNIRTKTTAISSRQSAKIMSWMPLMPNIGISGGMASNSHG